MGLNLSSAQILDLWESGVTRHPLDRALQLLRWMQPEMKLSELADISIGQRDQMLFVMRGQLFGRDLPAYIDCPQCKTRLEFILDTEAFRCEINNQPIEVDGLCIRPPTSRDIACVMSESGIERAMYQLAQRCCTKVGEQLSDELPEFNSTQLAKIESTLAEINADADIVLDFTCAQCDYFWQTPFDIGNYLWRELEKHAAELLNDIHTLARAYGWNEEEVLALSDVRRAAYIERALA